MSVATTNDKTICYRDEQGFQPTGVRCIDGYPSDWDVQRTKNLFRLVRDAAPADNDYELLSVYTDIGVRPRKDLEERGNRATTTDGYWRVKKGDLIVNKILAWMGAMGMSNYDGVTSPAYDILRPRKDINVQYYDYLLRCGILFPEFRARSKGIMDMRLRLYFDQFGQIPLPVPPRREQDAIVEFLDGKLAEIDRFIANKRRLIELTQLKASRTAEELTTGGTKGDLVTLSPSFGFLTSKPLSWNLIRLRYVCDFGTGGKDTENAEENGDYPFFVRSQTIERISSYSFNGEAVLTAGDGAGVGKVFHYFDGPFDYHQRVYRFSQFRHVCGRFFFHYLKSNLHREVLMGGAKSTVDSIRRPMLADFPILIPPPSELAGLVADLDSIERNCIDVVERIEQEITLMNEFRTSLIAEAVTGKIQVTG